MASFSASSSCKACFSCLSSSLKIFCLLRYFIVALSLMKSAAYASSNAASRFSLSSLILSFIGFPWWLLRCRVRLCFSRLLCR